MRIECACIVGNNTLNMKGLPGSGEINYANVLKVIRELGYKDFVATEYTPAKDPLATLAEVRAMAG